MRYWSPAAILRVSIGHLVRNVQFGTHEIVPATPQTAASPVGGRKATPANATCGPMSALGHKQTYAVHQPMSALHPIATAKADIGNPSCLLYPRKRTCAVH